MSEIIRTSVGIVWDCTRPQGSICVRNGRLVHLRVAAGRGRVGRDGAFRFASKGDCRLQVTVEGKVSPGSEAAIVSVRTTSDSFSFFLRDVTKTCPIVIPDYRVAVLDGDDGRTFEQVLKQARRGQTALERIEREPEESFDHAAAVTTERRCTTWLGVSRDMRVFELGFRQAPMDPWTSIRPRRHAFDVPLPETDNRGESYGFMLGRGSGPTNLAQRRLDDGVLPILCARHEDGGIVYDFTAFATLERSPLKAGAVRGTHFLVADGHSHGHMLTPDQRAQFDSLREGELNRPEETVLLCRAEASNPTDVPRYAWLKLPRPSLDWGKKVPYTYDGEKGFSVFSPSGVFCVARLGGKPMPQEELAVLLPPGGSVKVDWAFPHRPIPPARAAKLAKFDFDRRLDEARRFWRGKLRKAARVRLPEPRIEQMLQAGLLHLDLVAYGIEPRGTVVPSIGWYNAIGTESSPIIQFMDSMGWHSLAERSLEYFLDKQHDDGMIQNFGGYMIETGAALWCMGEHFRYTRDWAWVRRIAGKVLKSCEYLLRWRRRNLRAELRGRGYGMLDGKVADPEDPYRAWMLNGYAYLGLSRAAEMLRKPAPRDAARLAREAEALRRDIRTAFAEAAARSPVVPLEDGTWRPTCPPWAEGIGPACLMAKNENCCTHGAMVIRDIVGPIYLPFLGLLDAADPAVSHMLDYHAQLLFDGNVAFSQPYYCPHPFVHLERGEVKAFLASYYRTVAALADRETYSFWEHFFGISPHKTHEEAWFLMQTRRMLYRESGRELRLLDGVPRAWLGDGKSIEIDRAKCYFGTLSLKVRSRLESDGTIRASISCAGADRPRGVTIRLPHPEGAKAVEVIGGKYDPASECVVVDRFAGSAEVVLRFGRPGRE